MSVLNVIDGNTGDFVPLGLTTQDDQSFALQTIANVTFDAASTNGLGTLRTAEATTVFSSSSAYGLDTLRFYNTVGVTWDSTLRASVLTFTPQAQTSIIRQTYQYFPYQPGRPIRVLQTGWFSEYTGSSLVFRRGLYDDLNGVFWERSADGLLYGVVRNYNGSVVTDTKYLIDNAPDMSYNQLLVIELVWLGTLKVRWGYADVNGNVQYLRSVPFTGRLRRSYMQTATLPLRSEITGEKLTGTDEAIYNVCDALESEGGYINEPAFTFGAARTIANAIATTTEVPIVAIKPKATFETIPNNISITANELGLIAIGGSIHWSLRYYPVGSTDPLTNPNWTSANAQSGTEISIAATAVNLTGSIVLSTGFVAATTTGASRASGSGSANQTYPISLDPSGGNKPAILVLTAIGASASAAGSINWQEIR